MAKDHGARAANLLIDRAWEAYDEGRFQEALSAAGRAVEAATRLDDLVLLVKALRTEATCLRLMGDSIAALARYTRILGMAEDPVTSSRLDHSDAIQDIARAHWEWADSARTITSIPVRDLFRVLDAAERWLTAIGHHDWRAGVLVVRAEIYAQLDDWDAAIATAQEALAIELQHPDAPGYNLAAYRWTLGEILVDAGRPGEAVSCFRAILDDPASDLWSQRQGHQGLAECALAAGDLVAARREVRQAAQLAESLGDSALCSALAVMTRVCRAAGDLEQAWEAATRRLDAAARIGGHYRPYQAAVEAVGIALDRGDYDTARELLADLDIHAQAMDSATATTKYSSEAAIRHKRLASLEQTAS